MYPARRKRVSLQRHTFEANPPGATTATHRLCAGKEPVKNAGVCVPPFATHLSLNNLARHQNEREERESLYTQPPKNDRFGGNDGPLRALE
jgi:hypothetical protein